MSLLPLPGLVLALGLAAACAGSANAAPAPFQLSQPQISADGGRVQGWVCRQGPRAGLGQVLIQVRRGADGPTAAARLTGALGPANRGCARYDVAAAAPLSPSDPVQVCAVVRGQRACVERHGAD